MSDLTLERRDQTNETMISRLVMITPPITDDYWAYRVRLTDTQSVVGFPKFGTVGIGFAVEDDWNTNLPYTSAATAICDHIWHNRGDESITRDDVLTAIALIQDAAVADRAAPT